MFDDLIPPDPFSAPATGGKLDTMLVQAMLGAVSTGIELIRLRRDLGMEIEDDEVNDLVYLQQSVVRRIRTDQARRQKKARDIKERQQRAQELNDLPVIEDEDEDSIDVPF